MKNLKTLLILPVLLLLIGSLYASTIKADSSITITAVISNAAIAKDPGFTSQVSVLVSEYPFTYVDMNALPLRKYDFQCKNGQPFTVHIPDAPKICYMYISYTKPVATTDGSNWIDNIYILKRGDSLNATLYAKTYVFEGRGAAKLNCQSEIYALKYRSSSRLLKIMQSPESYLTGLEEMHKTRDSLQWLQLDVLQKYRSKLDKNIYQAMLANCIGLKYFGEIRGINSSPRTHWTNGAFTGSRIYRKISTLGAGNIPPENLAISPVYSSFLLERLKIAASLNGEGKPDIPSDPILQQRLLELIRKGYTGKLKDKLLTMFIVRFSRKSSFDTGNFTAVLNGMQDSLYINAVKKLAAVRKPGNIFKEFSLPDTKGQTVSLSSMKDKVVILDFWYTGCGNCVKLKKVMEPIYSQFHSNENVRFVSISIDQDRNSWLNSVKGGSYTGPEDINLFTAGEGARHPVIRENLIYAYPTLYVLKNGKIYSSTIPKFSTPSGRETFKRLILDTITK